jgi:hypothetical protein
MKESERYELCRNGVAIDKNDLDGEVSRQPELVHHSHFGYAVALSKRDALKQRVREAEAGARMRLRRGPDKVTVADMAALVEQDKRVVEANEHLQKAQDSMQRWDALREALRAKGHALYSLVQMHLAGSYASGSVKQQPQDPTDRVRGRVRRYQQS